MQHVVLDIGNTRIKCATFEKGSLKEVLFFNASHYDSLIKHLKSLTASHAILSTTQKNNELLRSFLTDHFHTIEFTHETPIPIKLTYQTPETLGDDRKAAVCGAYGLVGAIPFLVITAGTCITYNYFDGSSFVGGGISPGINLRFMAMHDYTGNLPLVEQRSFNQLIGMSTEQSMVSGVKMGLISEVEGIISRYQLLHQDLKVFICGGDTDFLESNIKYEIFANPNLVINGLHQILDYNLHT